MNESMNFLDALLSGNEEPMHYAVYLYENAEKYRWHDLRKDPTDFPPNNKILCEVAEIGIGCIGYRLSHCDSIRMELEYNDKSILAWRLHEPLE